jgi:hypothetical protein
MVQLSAWGGKYNGLNLVDSAKPNDRRNPTSRGGALINGRRYKLDVYVKLEDNLQSSIAVDINGTAFIRWKGPQLALTEDVFWRMPQPYTLGVASQEPIIFHSIQLRMKDGAAKLLNPREAAGAGNP